HIDLPDALPAVVARLRPPVQSDAGVRAEEINPPELFCSSGYKLNHIGFAAHIRLDGESFDGLSDLCRARFIKVGDNDARAFAGEAAAQGASDAGRAAGDDGDFIFQLHALPLYDC